MEALENLDEQQKQFEVVGPLVAACEAAKSQTSNMKSALRFSGFASARRGIAKDIFEAFDTAAKAPGTGDAAFLVVRDLALFVNNDRNDPETAFRLIDGLIIYRGAKPTRDMSNKLDEERSVLHRNWKMSELERHRGNAGTMSRIIDEMLIYAKGKDRAELNQLKSAADRKKNERIGWWVVIGGVILLIAIFGG